MYRQDTRNRIWCILALKCDIWCQYFNDFADNQLTNFIYLLVNPGFLSLPLKFLWASRFVPPTNGRPWETQRTDGCLSFHSFVS